MNNNCNVANDAHKVIISNKSPIFSLAILMNYQILVVLRPAKQNTRNLLTNFKRNGKIKTKSYDKSILRYL